ncbi:MAG: hypothetical protein O7B23_04025 [Deltaproteobacteria bacterium]|nr:hypothetical protein [Deltaproteobacteria bacterium]
MREAWKGTGIPTVPAAALQGEGVLETFEALLRQLYQQLDRRLSFGSKFGLTEEDFLEGLMVHFQEKKPKS